MVDLIGKIRNRIYAKQVVPDRHYDPERDAYWMRMDREQRLSERETERIDRILNPVDVIFPAPALQKDEGHVRRT